VFPLGSCFPVSARRTPPRLGLWPNEFFFTDVVWYLDGSPRGLPTTVWMALGCDIFHLVAFFGSIFPNGRRPSLSIASLLSPVLTIYHPSRAPQLLALLRCVLFSFFERSTPSRPPPHFFLSNSRRLPRTFGPPPKVFPTKRPRPAGHPHCRQYFLFFFKGPFLGDPGAAASEVGSLPP